MSLRDLVSYFVTLFATMFVVVTATMLIHNALEVVIRFIIKSYYRNYRPDEIPPRYAWGVDLFPDLNINSGAQRELDKHNAYMKYWGGCELTPHEKALLRLPNMDQPKLDEESARLNSGARLSGQPPADTTSGDDNAQL